MGTLTNTNPQVTQMPNQAPLLENSRLSADWISLLLISSQELKSRASSQELRKENSLKFSPPLQRPHLIRRRVRKGKISSKLAPIEPKTKFSSVDENFYRSCGSTET